MIRRLRGWFNPEDEVQRRSRSRLVAMAVLSIGGLLALPVVAMYLGALVGLFGWALDAMP